MSPRDHHLIDIAHAGAPARGVRVTASRGVCRVPDGPWRRFEGPATMAGFVGDLDNQSLTLYRSDACMRVLFGDVQDVRDDVAYRELVSPLSLEEALTFATFELAAQAVESEAIA